MHKILLGVPGSGMLCESAAQASWLSSLRHKVDRIPSNCSGPNFNACFVGALNACQEGHYDRYATIHTDIGVIEERKTCLDCHGEKCENCAHSGKRVYDRWLDIANEEMDKSGADFISIPMAIKDHRGVTSCGIGNPETPWNPWRRFTTAEFASMPETFCAADIGYADKYLLHSNALCLYNMKSPLWWKTDKEGCIRAIFNFTERIIRGDDGKWVRQQDSEDWAFSRRLWELGAKTYITSRIKTVHHGVMSYENHGDWGIWKNGDEDTASQWRTSLANSPVKKEVCHAS